MRLDPNATDWNSTNARKLQRAEVRCERLFERIGGIHVLSITTPRLREMLIYTPSEVPIDACLAATPRKCRPFPCSTIVKCEADWQSFDAIVDQLNQS